MSAISASIKGRGAVTRDAVKGSVSNFVGGPPTGAREVVAAQGTAFVTHRSISNNTSGARRLRKSKVSQKWSNEYGYGQVQ